VAQYCGRPTARERPFLSEIAIGEKSLAASKEMIMQLALRPYAAVGVAVLGAGLIYVTPTTAPDIEQRRVHLAASEDIIDLVNPIDAVVSALTGAGVLPSLGDLSGTFTEAVPGAADLQLLDPAFWEMFGNALIDPSGESPELLLVGAIEQLPVVGPLLESFGLFVVFPVSLLLAYAWSEIAPLLGLGTGAAAAEDLGIGSQGVYDSALGVLDPTTLVQDVSTALEPSVLTSVLDLTPIADIGTVVDPSGLADIGTVLSTSTIPDLGDILASLMP
jgi:hypothetical protein